MTRCVWSLLLVVSALVGGACDLADRGRDVVVEDHRQSAGARVGVFRALQVHDCAVDLTRRLGDKGDPQCHLLRDGPLQLSITVLAKVEGPSGAVAASFEHRRKIARDQAGNFEVTDSISFRNPTGRTGETKQQERVVGEERFLKEENLPWVRHRLRPGQRDRVLQAAVDPVPAMLAMGASGWQNEGGDRWVAHGRTGGLAFRCAALPGPKGWLARLLGLTELNYSEATLPQHLPEGETKRSVSARLTTLSAPQRKLRIDIEEIFEPVGPQDILVPADVADTGRDRPYRDIQTILGDRLGLSEWKR